MNLDHKIKTLILQKVTGLSRDQLFLNPPSNPLPDKQERLYDKLIERYKSGEPIEYILENTNFYGLDFFVDSRVLIPRDDTEVMVENTLKENCDILIDVGTGSSCIPISILINNNSIKKCFVIDISEKALKVSKINIKKHKLDNKITQIHGNLLNNFITPPSTGTPLEKGKNNIVITANLPYIKNGDSQSIDNETMQFEPDLALYGGENTGFELYEKLIYQAIELKSISPCSARGELEGKITLFIEVGFDQKEVCKKFLERLNLHFEFFKDNQGVNRCVKIEI